MQRSYVGGNQRYVDTSDFIFFEDLDLKNMSFNWLLCVICTTKMVLLRNVQLHLESYGQVRIGLQN